MQLLFHKDYIKSGRQRFEITNGNFQGKIGGNMSVAVKLGFGFLLGFFY